MLGALAKLIQLTIHWAGADVFTDTRSLVLARRDSAFSACR